MSDLQPMSVWQNDASKLRDDLSLGARERVERDVHKGLGGMGAFDVRKDEGDIGFRPVEEFGAEPLSNGEWTAVAWEFVGTHTGAFLGIEATHRQVTIQGVTLVASKGDEFQRYIHLPGLLGQLGVTLTRPTIGDGDEGTSPS
jgi:hypothetical protein